MKRLLLLAFMAISLHAETVYLTAHGKTYHSNPKCMALAKSSHVLTTDDATAIAHGLHECGICAHRHHAETVNRDNKNWAKPEAAK
jgi:hypothetical protein